jgi:ferrous iron transport protein A
VTTPSEPPVDKAFPLAMAGEGARVRIQLLRGGKGLEMRLTSLGLNVGSELVVSQHQGGKMVVLRGETRLALGAGMAQKIMVVERRADRD